MVRIGIFGGSFNPIHNGHVQLCELLCKENLIDELWLMVSPHNPFKNQKDLLCDSERLQLAKLATESSKIKVSDFEFHLPKPSYTHQTLTSLRKNYPDKEFILIIGADNWISFSRWYKSAEILSSFKILIYPRSGYQIDIKELPSTVTILDFPLVDISSTYIRQLIKERKDVSTLLPLKVWKEIKKKKLYLI